MSDRPMNNKFRNEHELPIHEVIPQIKDALSSHRSAVLIAEPGAGKTTETPLALLNEPWLEGKKIIMLEPRRLAARSAAAYMSKMLGEQVGQTVGYRVRWDSKVSKDTRIEVVTEGILTRMLQADPELEGARLVIFDEFHERSIHADLGLALTLQSQSILREDLRILIMSATLHGERIAELLGDAPIIESKGRVYPVETRYVPILNQDDVETVMKRTIIQSIQHDQGDILAFLPGAKEIRRVQSALENEVPSDVILVPLYGNLPLEQQDAAIRPAPAGKRKVVLATSIAESSLTVEGITIVIDSGLQRVSKFSPRTGMAHLTTVKVSKASADQRRGRAGRLAPGICYRLWSEQEERMLRPFSVPEILEADLVPLALELAGWGTADPNDLLWLDVPPKGAYEHAVQLLEGLGALKADGSRSITTHGKAMASLGVHPRIANMLLKAKDLGLGYVAARLGALLQERDLFRGQDAARKTDIRLRLEALLQADEGVDIQEIDLAVMKRIKTEADHFMRILDIDDQPIQDSQIDMCGLLLCFAYPDRIGRRRSNGRYTLQNGRGAYFAHQDHVSEQDYIVAAELDDQGTESRIQLAAPVDGSELEQHFASHIEKQSNIYWDREAEAIRAKQVMRMGSIILRETQLANPSQDELLAILLEAIKHIGLQILPWKPKSKQLQQRMMFMHKQDDTFPDVSDEALLATLDSWLAPYVIGMKSRQDLERLDLAAILQSMLSWEQLRQLDEYAPTHMIVPSGSRIPIHYSDGESPYISVRLQEMFGLQETPRIGGGKVPITLHLLSPAQRPVQVTSDLASFWKHAYFEVKKDLKGRYPKHYWPDNPLEAIATHRAKPKS